MEENYGKRYFLEYKTPCFVSRTIILQTKFWKKNATLTFERILLTKKITVSCPKRKIAENTKIKIVGVSVV